MSKLDTFLARTPGVKRSGNGLHVTQFDLGGANEDWNMQLLTATCNLSKHTKDPILFMQSRGFLL